MLYSLLVATSIGYALAFSPARNSRFLSVKGTQLGAKAEPKPDNETQEQLRARMQRKARKMVLISPDFLFHIKRMIIFMYN